MCSHHMSGNFWPPPVHKTTAINVFYKGYLPTGLKTAILLAVLDIVGVTGLGRRRIVQSRGSSGSLTNLGTNNEELEKREAGLGSNL